MNEKEINYPKVVVLGAGGHGTSAALASIIAAHKMTMKDIHIIKSDDIEDVKLQIKDLPKDSIVLVEDINFLLSEIVELPKTETFKLTNTYKDMPRDVILRNEFNNKDFGGHKKGNNRKLRRV